MEELDEVTQTEIFPPSCGGVPKPAPKEGVLGDWVCIGEQWVWEAA